MSTVWGLIKGYENATVRDIFVGSKKTAGEVFRTGR